MRLFFLVFLLNTSISAQDYWQLHPEGGILWNLTEETRLPHRENIELSGKYVSAILYYTIDAERNLSLERDIIFPQLRTFVKTNEPDWKKYRAYFRRTIGVEGEPSLSLSQEARTLVPGPVDSVRINGTITFYHAPVRGIALEQTIFPSMDEPKLHEHWRLVNVSEENRFVIVQENSLAYREQGYLGSYVFANPVDEPGDKYLEPGWETPLKLEFQAREGKYYPFTNQGTSLSRENYLQEMADNLILETPDPVLNQLFAFSKIRAAESIFASDLGLIHSPGGGNYYVGIWANDQVEYSGPFFPYLGYTDGNTAAFNAYDHFRKNIPEGEGHIPYAFEVNGNFPMTHLDRGDAAMIAYGTSQYALNRGDRTEAEALWPLIEWSINYCERMRNEDGAVRSESDEMEGRIPTGDANLSTSSLYYGGLLHAGNLARALGKQQLALQYDIRRLRMGEVIENYFGAEMDGLATYRYFAGNKHLRHWICLPLVMDISDRREATLTALFDKLWTDDGILVELNPDSDKEPIFWDRATLYAFRGALRAGATELALERLRAFSRERLLGEHVPYVIEAYPENNRKHLSAESALYCRIFTEGLLGMDAVSFDVIRLQPRLPKDWDAYALRKIGLFGLSMDVEIRRAKNGIQVTVTTEGETRYDTVVEPGAILKVKLR
ncbi:MAG: six-hairpin glycosidase-like protein [Bacteroidota bacterium]